MDSRKSAQHSKRNILISAQPWIQRFKANRMGALERDSYSTTGSTKRLLHALPIIILLGILLIAAMTPNAHGLHGDSEYSDQPISYTHKTLQSNSKLRVYYAGPPDNVLSALKLHAGFTLVDNPDQAQVLVLNGSIPEQEKIQALISSGTGVILILGPNLTSEQVSALLGGNLVFEFQDQPLSLVTTKNEIDPITTDIVWNSAPQVRQRYAVTGQPLSLHPLVTGFEESTLILGQSQAGNGLLYLFTPFLDHANPQFQEWAYFNYFI